MSVHSRELYYYKIKIQCAYREYILCVEPLPQNEIITFYSSTSEYTSALQHTIWVLTGLKKKLLPERVTGLLRGIVYIIRITDYPGKVFTRYNTSVSWALEKCRFIKFFSKSPTRWWCYHIVACTSCVVVFSQEILTNNKCYYIPHSTLKKHILVCLLLLGFTFIIKSCEKVYLPYTVFFLWGIPTPRYTDFSERYCQYP